MREVTLPGPVPSSILDRQMRAIYSQPLEDPIGLPDLGEMRGVFGYDPSPCSLSGYRDTDAIGVFHPPLRPLESTAVRFFRWIIQQRCAPPVPSAAQKP